MESLKKKTANGLLWGGLSNIIQQFLNLVFGIFLARMLSQFDYGIIGMLTFFFTISLILFEGGCGLALNQKSTVTQNDYNAVFWVNNILGLFFYIVLFFCAPLIAQFYKLPVLIPLSRYLFLIIPITALGLAPRAYMYRNMMVREEAIISFFCILSSGFVGLIMAANGYAYWGIATQQIIYLFIATIMRFYFSKWRPNFNFDFSPIKDIFRFSSKLIITNLFNTLNINIFSVLLGKMYTPHVVGNYTQANKWCNMGASVIGGMLSGVTQPVLAKIDEKNRQIRVFRKILRFTAFLSFPCMFGLALISQEFIITLLTSKWIESAKIMQILCIGAAFSPIISIFPHYLISRGQSTSYMWASIALCITQLVAIFFSANYGIICMVVIYVTINVLWFFVWFYLVHRIMDIHLLQILEDIVPFGLISAIVILLTGFITQNIESNFLLIVSRVTIAATLYLSVMKLLKVKIFEECISYFYRKTN